MTDRELLRAVLAEVRALRALVERRLPVPAREVDDDPGREWLRVALPALARMPKITPAGAIARAQNDADLARALGDCVRRKHGAMSLGRRLAKAAEAGVVVDGRKMIVAGTARSGPVYRVQTLQTSPERALIAQVMDIVTREDRTICERNRG